MGFTGAGHGRATRAGLSFKAFIALLESVLPKGGYVPLVVRLRF